VLFVSLLHEIEEFKVAMLSRPTDIWTLHPDAADRAAGAKYAAITLPWTFNRMMKNTGSKGQAERALNIAKGIVGQAVLKRELSRLGIAASGEEKHYRSSDLFDLKLRHGDRDVLLDLKTVHYYTNYPNDQRPPLTPGLVIEHSRYDGPDWRTFFPMLVPQNQMSQAKTAYCFAVASSITLKPDVDANRSAYAITAFVHGEAKPFLTGQPLILRREERRKGFRLGCEYKPAGLFRDTVAVDLVGEWAGNEVRRRVKLKPGNRVSKIGPFSSLVSVAIERDDYERFDGVIEIDIDSNDLDESVLGSSRREINVEPDVVLEFRKADFVNLILPDDYVVHFLGWTDRGDFLTACRKYRSWVWPNDRENRFHNQPWGQLTVDDTRMAERLGMQDRLRPKEIHRLAFGIMKASPGGSASCYYYPNIFGGGLRDTNLYVLPQDLNTMESVGGLLAAK
jgi:hypothetical protein